MRVQRLLSLRPGSRPADWAYRFVNHHGSTLIEVLIAALISGFTIAAGMQLLINQNKNHRIQQGISDMQHNGRVTVDELVDKIRQAGYKLPLGLPALTAWNSDPDTIAVTFLVEPMCTVSLSDPMPQPSAELKCVGWDVSCFTPDTWAYIYDPVAGSGEFFYVTEVQESSMHIQHNLGALSKSYPAGSEVFMLDYYKFYVDESDTAHPSFMMEKNGASPVIYADNIRDLQFRYVMSDGSEADTISLARYVRKVNIEVEAETENNDLFTNDRRRDTLSTMVQVRNLDLGS